MSLLLLIVFTTVTFAHSGQQKGVARKTLTTNVHEINHKQGRSRHRTRQVVNQEVLYHTYAL